MSDEDIVMTLLESVQILDHYHKDDANERIYGGLHDNAFDV